MSGERQNSTTEGVEDRSEERSYLKEEIGVGAFMSGSNCQTDCKC
jgi:hypothetical protein